MGNSRTAEDAACDRVQAETSIMIDGHKALIYGHEGEALPDLNHRGWRYEADKCEASYNSAWYAYHLDDGKQLEISVAEGYPEDAGIEPIRSGLEALKQWWWDQTPPCDLEEWLVEWGYTDPVTAGIVKKATPDYDGVCRIWREPQYQSSCYDPPLAGYVRHEDPSGEKTDEIWEGTYAEAEAYVNDYYDAPSGYDGIKACNVLAHGQISADRLMIIKTH